MGGVRKQLGSSLRPKIWDILDRAVFEGVGFGWMRAHKYQDKPDEEHVKETIAEEVMNAIGEVFDFSDGM